MASFPNRCQHIKVNGTQCECPALRRNRFCYFHKRHHEERIQLNVDRARRRPAIVELPVLEDANSIQVSLLQIMRLLVAGQIDGKIAGLLLYALQTATLNLARTTFEPRMHNVILDPAAVRETPLGAHIWEDSDFTTEEEDEETLLAEALEESRRKARKKAEREQSADAEAQRLMEEGAREREASRQRAAETAAMIRRYELDPPKADVIPSSSIPERDVIPTLSNAKGRACPEASEARRRGPYTIPHHHCGQQGRPGCQHQEHSRHHPRRTRHNPPTRTTHAQASPPPVSQPEKST